MKNSREKEIKKLKTLINNLKNRDDISEKDEIVKHLKDKLEKEQNYECSNSKLPWIPIIMTGLGVSVFWLLVIVLIQQRNRNNNAF